jgi:lipid A disaccharide synthetase
MMAPARGLATASALRVFIVAGEASGDAIGSRLMTALKSLSSHPLDFAGIGGWGLSLSPK